MVKKTVKKPVKKAIKKSVKKTLKKIVRKPAKKAVKKIVKKAAKKTLKKSVKPAALKAVIIGKIMHYFPKVKAAVIRLKSPLAVGDSIRIKGHTTDFVEIVKSIQLDHSPIKRAGKGAEIGLEVKSRVRRHDTVYQEGKLK